MKAHIIGGGLAGLAAAASLIRDGGLMPANITIYDAAEALGGAMCCAGTPATGYVLPTGRVFEREYRCAFELFSMLPSATDPGKSVKDDILAFNAAHPFDAKARILGRDGQVLRQPQFGLSLRDRLDLVRLALTPEAMLDGRSIAEFFSAEFFRTEFWILWTTLMNSLPEHSAMEMRRFMHRFLHVLPDLSNMHRILRTPFNQHEAIALPLTRWLAAQGVALRPGAVIEDIAVTPGTERITVTALKGSEGATPLDLEVAPGDLVFLTLGSQTADLAIGSHTDPPRRRRQGRSWSLWERLAQRCGGLGHPEVFFGPQHLAHTSWVTFTVTTEEPGFFQRMQELTGNAPGTGGLTTLSDSSWLITFSIFHQPEFIAQPEGTMVWWGFLLHPQREGDFVRKPATACTGAELLRETLMHLPLGEAAQGILASSTCIPCLLPYAGSPWMVRQSGDRPPVVPEGSTNLGLIGLFAETPYEATFTMEYAVRTAREAVAALLRLKHGPPPPYQGQHDPAALLHALQALS